MRLITIILALTVCTMVSAQPKQSKRCPAPIYSRDFANMEILDTTQIRVRYAFCAEKVRIVFHIPQKENEGREKR